MSSIFQFQAMLVAVVNAISGSMLSTEKTVAYVLMTICLVLGVYESYARGGDIRSLAGAFLKYIVAAFRHWLLDEFLFGCIYRLQSACQFRR